MGQGLEISFLAAYNLSLSRRHSDFSFLNADPPAMH